MEERAAVAEASGVKGRGQWKSGKETSIFKKYKLNDLVEFLKLREKAAGKESEHSILKSEKGGEKRVKLVLVSITGN